MYKRQVLELLYSIFSGKGILARSARFINEGIAPVHLLNAMSLSLDLPDSDYVWMQFSGVWARERHIIAVSYTHLDTGIWPCADSGRKCNADRA